MWAHQVPKCFEGRLSSFLISSCLNSLKQNWKTCGYSFWKFNMCARTHTHTTQWPILVWNVWMLQASHKILGHLLEGPMEAEKGWKILLLPLPLVKLEEYSFSSFEELSKGELFKVNSEFLSACLTEGLDLSPWPNMYWTYCILWPSHASLSQWL